MAEAPTVPPWMSVTVGGEAAARCADDDRRVDRRVLFVRQVSEDVSGRASRLRPPVRADAAGVGGWGLSTTGRTVTAEGEGGDGGLEDGTVAADHTGVGGELRALPLDEVTSDGREGAHAFAPSRAVHSDIAAGGWPRPTATLDDTRGIAAAMPASVTRAAV